MNQAALQQQYMFILAEPLTATLIFILYILQEVS